MVKEEPVKESIDGEGASNVVTSTTITTAATIALSSEELRTQSPSEIDKGSSGTEGVAQRKGLFWLISISNSTAQSFIWNFFSAFAALIGVTSSEMGFLTSIRNLVSSLFQGNIGRLSDKFGRRYILLIGFFLSFAIMTALIFISSPLMLIIIAIIQAFSISIIIPVWNAALGDVTEAEERAAYIGKLSAGGTAVSVSLILLVASLFYITDTFNGWTILSWTIPNIEEKIQYGVAFGITAFNFLICIIGVFLLRETRIIKKEVKTPRMVEALKDKTFVRFLIINSFFGLMMATGWPIFPLVQINVLEMTFPQVAITSAVFSVFSSLSMFFGGRIGDKIGRKPLIIIGRIAIFAIPVFFIVAVLTGFWQFLLITNVIGGTSTGFATVALNAYVLDLAPEDMMGAYSGLMQVVWGLATFIGSLCSGFIAQAIEDAYGLQTMAIAMLTGVSVVRILASIGYFFLRESLPKVVLEAKKLRKTKMEEQEIPCSYYPSLFEESQTKIK